MCTYTRVVRSLGRELRAAQRSVERAMDYGIEPEPEAEVALKMYARFQAMFSPTGTSLQQHADAAEAAAGKIHFIG